MKNKIVFILIVLLGGISQVYSQKLEATKDSALVEISLRDFDDYPIIYCELTIIVRPNGDKIHTKTDRNGKTEVLIPKTGRTTYVIEADYRGELFQFEREFKIPQDEGAYILTANLTYRSQYVALGEVEFPTGSHILLEKSFEELNRVVEMMEIKPGMEVEISGHTDSIGDFHYNMRLSERRAMSVREYIVSKDIDGQRVTAKGFGPTEPIGDNQSEEGRQRNRRIEIRVTKE